MLVIVQFPSSVGWYVGDCCLLLLKTSLVALYTGFLFNDVNLSLIETQIYKYTVYVNEMVKEKKKCLVFVLNCYIVRNKASLFIYFLLQAFIC